MIKRVWTTSVLAVVVAMLFAAAAAAGAPLVARALAERWPCSSGG